MKKHDVYMIIIGLIVVIGFFALLCVLVFVEIKQTNKDLLNIALGGLMGSFVTVISYFYGSSQGSKIKTE